MNEYAVKPTSLEVKQENNRIFSEFLPAMAENFLKKISAIEVTRPFFTTQEDEIIIYDSLGNQQKLYVKMVFSGHGFIPGFDKGPHLLSILLYDSEEKRKAHVKNIEEHMNYKKKDSSSYVAHRTWSIFYSPDNDLEITSAMNTFPELRGLGIAQSLLQDGEYIKDNLVSELSEKMVVRTAITEIRDNSEPAGWTTRQAQQMDGYELQNDFTFLKTVTYS